MRSFYGTIAVNRLDEQVRSAMNIMVIEIRRAGYSANAANDISTGANTNPFAASANDISVVVQIMQIYPFTPTPTPVPLLVKNNVNLSGNLNISNMSTGTTIWNGGPTALSGSASTSSNTRLGSSSGGLSSDVVQNNSGLSNLTSDQFFSDFFGSTKALAQQSALLQSL